MKNGKKSAGAAKVTVKLRAREYARLSEVARRSGMTVSELLGVSARIVATTGRLVTVALPPVAMADSLRTIHQEIVALCERHEISLTS
ncbi:MAG: hypothetical protein LBK99_06520 [Opitutaceae bacterium]|jgi:hypothetical protein|nr:hypothetical protein [Opitutaceae bacterium]